MDGSVALFWLITSLFDMTQAYCATGCLMRNAAPARLSFQGANIEYQRQSIGTELYLGYDLDHAYGPFHPTVAASITDTNDLWAGAGFKWTSTHLFIMPIFLEASFIPGIYLQDSGPDLGGIVQFRSAVGAGYAFDGGSTVTISWDHRSNGDTQSINPGLETLSIRYAFALN
ncbi:MAG: lipid A 3-O-deacylase [bacterium]|jgi:lipid A 3-O-deacylase